MKLLIDARNLGSKPSGVGMYAYNWIKALEKQKNFDIHVIVDVIESGQIKELDADERVTVHCYGRTSNKRVSVYRYFKYVQQTINCEEPDIFWEVNNLAAIKLNNPYGKYIVTIHDMFPITMSECFGKIYPYYFRYGVKKTINDVDGIIYNSNCTKIETERFFPKAKEKQNTISYIIIPPIPQMNVEEKDYFLYMGNLERRKGVDILLDAYEMYVKQGGQRELVIAGKIREDDIGERLKELDKNLQGLHYVGYADDKMRTRLYRECGCFVFPSRAEGFGMPIIEAMQCGKPVIASDLEIFKELAPDAINTFSLQNDTSDVNRLCDMMLSWNESMVDAQLLKKEAGKYSEAALSKEIEGFLLMT